MKYISLALDFATCGYTYFRLVIGPHLSPLDVLSLGTFCPLGRFVFWDVLSLGTFCPLGCFVLGTLCPWDVLSLGTFCPWDVLSLGRFVLGRFVCASSL